MCFWYTCVYCGAKPGTIQRGKVLARSDLTVDHILPRSRGGKDHWTNTACACYTCNHRKGSRTPDEARMPLRRKPFRPSHVMFIRDYVGTIDDTWKPYLFLQ